MKSLKETLLETLDNRHAGAAGQPALSRALYEQCCYELALLFRRFEAGDILTLQLTQSQAAYVIDRILEICGDKTITHRSLLSENDRTILAWFMQESNSPTARRAAA